MAKQEEMNKIADAFATKSKSFSVGTSGLLRGCVGGAIAGVFCSHQLPN
jgi:hypothetical protein